MAETNEPAADPTPAKKPVKKRAKKPAGAPFRPQVHVRMYCHGLGDCFLLRVEYAEGKNFHALIDCGVYKGTAKPTELMTEVAQDIAAKTGGRLDLLVVTHEHWDHLSGFDQAGGVFAGMTITEVWQPWTDSPLDGLATTLRAKYEKAKARLVGLMRRADAAPGAAHRRGLAEAFEVMSFFGVERPAAAAAAAAGGDPCARVKAFLATIPRRQYLVPGEVREVGETGVKAFVLGPPASEASLRKTDIAKADAFARKHLALFEGFDAVLGAAEASLPGATTGRPGNPFDARQEVPLAAAREADFFRTLYGFDDNPEHPEAFRSIDGLAFESLGRLALRMDNYTNNTSLVLAFRLPSGDVLLFPGDAQGGNWKSWADAADGPLAFAAEGTDARRLLAATVLYKVSHHGSHNATPRTYGLDRMTSPRLRAFVPVDADAVKQAGYGQMPLRAILDALKGEVDALKGETGRPVYRGDHANDPPGVPNPVFKVSAETFSDATAVPGRAMSCETSFPLD